MAKIGKTEQVKEEQRQYKETLDNDAIESLEKVKTKLHFLSENISNGPFSEDAGDGLRNMLWDLAEDIDNAISE